MEAMRNLGLIHVQDLQRTHPWNNKIIQWSLQIRWEGLAIRNKSQTKWVAWIHLAKLIGARLPRCKTFSKVINNQTMPKTLRWKVKKMRKLRWSIKDDSLKLNKIKSIWRITMKKWERSFEWLNSVSIRILNWESKNNSSSIISGNWELVICLSELILW